MGEAMIQADYAAAIARRQRSREIYARLAGRYDAAITLAAPGAAPVGLGSTGNPVFNVPASLLGIPAVSLPVLSTEGLPLGLQIMEFAGGERRAVRDRRRHPGAVGAITDRQSRGGSSRWRCWLERLQLRLGRRPYSGV